MVATLTVRGLCVSTGEGQHLLSDVNFTIKPGERVGLIGASGSGKSLTAGALCGLLRPPLRVSEGVIMLDRLNLPDLTPRGWQAVRGRRIFQIFQSPGTALTPALRVGRQLAEAARIAGEIPAVALPRALKSVLLDEDICRQYPYQLSGGMKQRVLIAMALLLRPDILIADEPTTGLDVLTEAEVLKTLDNVIRETGTSLLFISHDLRAVRAMASRTLVMHEGRIVEDTRLTELAKSRHPAAQALSDAAKKLETPC